MNLGSEHLAHRGTTRHVQAVYPFVAEGGLGGRGVYVGRDLFGGAFTYDPWVLYKQELSGPNVMVIGQIGYGKSSLVKSYLFRQQVFGRRSVVIDPKGEYGSLVEALPGATVLRLRPFREGVDHPGSVPRLNPLDPLIAGDQQLSVVETIGAAQLGRELNQLELGALGVAHRAVTDRAAEQGRVPVMPELVECLLHPDPAAAADLGMAVDHLCDGSRELALGLRRLTQGYLRGMFDGPSTVTLDPDCPLLVVDLSAVLEVNEQLVPIVMIVTAAWLQTLWTRGDGHKRVVVFDEAWRMFRTLSIGRWLQAALKLARQYQTSIMLVMHAFSDLTAAGAEGSEQVKLAEGLLRDCETRVVYRQQPGEVARVRDLAGLTDAEAALLPDLDQGVALWRVGRRSFLVHHRLSSIEAEIVNTDLGFSARRPVPPAVPEPVPAEVVAPR